MKDLRAMICVILAVGVVELQVINQEKKVKALQAQLLELSAKQDTDRADLLGQFANVYMNLYKLNQRLQVRGTEL